MQDISELKAEAERTCQNRGHNLGIWFKPWRNENRRLHVERAVCKRCFRDVDVNPKPAPNEIDISGEAVALNCAPLTVNELEVLNQAAYENRRNLS